MKKILFILIALSFIACNRDKLYKGSPKGRSPYQTITQVYRGDSLQTSLTGDSVMFYTNLGFFSFNKPLLLNGDTIGGVGLITANTLTVDSLKMGSSIYLTSAGFGYPGIPIMLQISPNFGSGGGIGLANVSGMQFNSYNSDIITGFLNDTTANDGDTAIIWSAKAIKEYVSVNGGGSGTVTIGAKQLAFGTSANVIGGLPKFMIIDSTLKVNNTDTDTGIYVINPGNKFGILFKNELAGQGIYGINTATSTSELIYLYGTSGSTGTLLHLNQSGSGKAIFVTKGASNIFTVSDSVYMNCLNAVTRFGYLYMDSATHSVKIDSSVISASYGFNIKKTLQEILSDTSKGEIAWPLSLTEWTHDLDRLLPNEKFRILVAMQEYTLTKLYEQEKRNDDLEKRIEDLENNINPSQNQGKFYIGFIIFMGVLLIVFAIKRK